LLGLIAIPFAFVGINSYFQTNINNDIALVDGLPITALDYQQGFQNYLRQVRSLTGANFDISQYDTPISRRRFLEQMIDQRVIQMYAEKSGFAVSEEELARAVMEIQAFQIDGRFDNELYRNMLAAQGMSPRGFEQQMAADMVRVQLPRAIAETSIATHSEIEMAAKLQGQTRNFRALTIASADFVDTVQVAEEQVAEFFAENAARFMSEEQVIIEYLELDAHSFNDLVEINEEELQARYTSQESRFINPESRLASHILLNVVQDADEATVATVEQSAQDLADRIRGGEDFAQLAAEFSDDTGSAESGGDLGWIEPGIMVSAFEDALYAMQSPGVSDPVRTSFGFHIIQLHEVQEAEGMSFEDARPQLLQEFQEEEADRLYLEQADRLVDMVYEDDSTLEPAAEELGLPILTAGPFGRAGGEGIAANQVVIDAAFTDLVLREGAASDAIDIDNNHIVVLRVVEHLPSIPQELEEVRDTIVAELSAAAAAAAARAHASSLLDGIVAGTSDLESIAAEREQDLVVAENAVRRDFQYGLELVTAVFELPAGGELPQFHVVEAGGDYSMVELQAITAGSLEADPQQQLQYLRAVANSAGATEQSGLVATLRARADIQVFEDQITRIQ
jgi:peptidyl-prolyl cis-trans isomerase D